MFSKALMIGVVLTVVLMLITHGVPSWMKEKFAGTPAAAVPGADASASVPVLPLAPAPAKKPAASAASEATSRPPEPACERREDRDNNRVTITCR